MSKPFQPSLLVGLTGGVASGKSFVAGIMSSLGAMVIDSDSVGHSVIEAGQPAHDDVIRHFGKSVLGPKGLIDRVRLGEIIFNNPAEKRILESITHPHIIGRIASSCVKATEAGVRIVTVESAIIFEMGIQEAFEKVITVYVDSKTQISRLMARNLFSREEALAIVHSQMSIDRKASMSDFVIDNSGMMEETEALTRELYSRLLNLKH